MDPNGSPQKLYHDPIAQALEHKAAFSPPLIVAFILMGGFNVVDIVARRYAGSEVWSGLIFRGCLFLLSSLVNISFSAWRIFVIEEKYGFNRTMVKTFILDILKDWDLAADQFIRPLSQNFLGNGISVTLFSYFWCPGVFVAENCTEGTEFFTI